MTLHSQKEKAVQLRDLHRGPNILVLANAWDAGSARVFEDAGWPVIATSSAGVAFTLGYPDGQIVPRDEMLFMIRRIVSTVRVPVTADIEAGFGADSVDGVVETARKVIEAGAVGINLEDRATDREGIVSIDLQTERIRAVRAMADAMDIPLVINARTDVFHFTHGTLEERTRWAIERASAYFDSGADCFFAPFVTDRSTISTLASQASGPLNILAVPGSPTIEEMQSLGVARVSIGGGPCRAALGLARRIARELSLTGTYGAMTDGAVTYAEMNALLARE